MNRRKKCVCKDAGCSFHSISIMLINMTTIQYGHSWF